MEYDTKTNFYHLSTGKAFYAHTDMLCPNADADELHYGHDGLVEPDYDERFERVAVFTQEERREIANHMIARWNRWANIKTIDGK